MNYVLTHFKSSNFGTVAQALCASVAVDGEIINYTHPDRVKMFWSHAQNSDAEMECFNWKLPLTKPFRCKEEVWEFLDDPFKTVWMGSDEILKFDPYGGSGNPSLQEFPTVFYLPEWVRCRKILLAGCLGIPVKDLPICHNRLIAKSLDEFAVLSVRDADTWDFIRRASPTLANRTELIPDPTWTLYPETLEMTPLRSYKECQVASSYHRLIALLMQHKQPLSLTDQRPKTRELAERFRVSEWSLDHVQKQCQTETRAFHHFIQKCQSLPQTGLLTGHLHG